MTVVVRIKGTDKMIEVEDVVNFKMDTAHFWLKLKGDDYKTFWRTGDYILFVRLGNRFGINFG